MVLEVCNPILFYFSIIAFIIGIIEYLTEYDKYHFMMLLAITDILLSVIKPPWS